MSGPAWEIEALVARLGGRNAVDGASLKAWPGEVVGVLGPNGSGKTTLLRAGLGLTGIESGTVRLGGEPLERLTETRRARLAGYLPQERRVSWNLPALEVVALGAHDLPPARAREIAADSLMRVGLSGFEGRGVLDMSGGERARVLLARLLATRAPLLVADEPAAGLDPDAQLLTLDLLRGEAKRGAAVVVTLHDLALAARACDRLVVMSHGKQVADAAPREALTPEVLRSTFGLDGRLVELDGERVLSARRAG